MEIRLFETFSPINGPAFGVYCVDLEEMSMTIFCFSKEDSRGLLLNSRKYFPSWELRSFLLKVENSTMPEKSTIDAIPIYGVVGINMARQINSFVSATEGPFPIGKSWPMVDVDLTSLHIAYYRDCEDGDFDQIGSYNAFVAGGNLNNGARLEVVNSKIQWELAIDNNHYLPASSAKFLHSLTDDLYLPENSKKSPIVLSGFPAVLIKTSYEYNFYRNELIRGFGPLSYKPIPQIAVGEFSIN